jgi:hypothetical protein
MIVAMPALLRDGDKVTHCHDALEQGSADAGKFNAGGPRRRW